MSKQLLIVFVKNPIKGQVKSRLAKTIGDDRAFEVYEKLISITERETLVIDNVDMYVYFSDYIDSTLWPGQMKFTQKGNNLGERMYHAFEKGFEHGYDRIVGIGSDLPDLNAKMIKKALHMLSDHTTVFGPSEDGGYYLLGMNRLINCIFENKAWSTDNLLDVTLKELDNKGIDHYELEPLNDIDTYEDLINSSLDKDWIKSLSK